MKSLFSKKIIASAVTAFALFAVGSAQAAPVFPDFTVNPPGTTPANFVADKITGNYREVATFTGSTFTVSLLWNAGQFVRNDGTLALSATRTGLSSTYGLYALYKASGTVSTSGTETTFLFTPGSGSFDLFMDQNNDSIFDINDDPAYTAPLTGAGSFLFDPTLVDDDVRLASGVALAGEGTLDPSLSTCGQTNGINCGSFGSTTSFFLTPAGKNYFVLPNPFYDLSFQSGQLNNFDPTGTQEINGSLDVVFGFAPIPEPASVGLLGLGLLGLGAARRRKQAK